MGPKIYGNSQIGPSSFECGLKPGLGKVPRGPAARHPVRAGTVGGWEESYGPYVWQAKKDMDPIWSLV